MNAKIEKNGRKRPKKQNNFQFCFPYYFFLYLNLKSTSGTRSLTFWFARKKEVYYFQFFLLPLPHH